MIAVVTTPGASHGETAAEAESVYALAHAYGALLDAEVGLRRLPAHPVDRQDVLRARRERHHQVHLRPEAHVAARCRHRLAPRQAPVRRPRNVHEQVERGWRGRNLETELGESRVEVVAAV